MVLVVAGIALALMIAGAYALEALKPGLATPAQTVLARKALMQANFANYGDAKAKVAAANVKAVAVNARSMMVFGGVMPTLLTDAYADAYAPGAKFYFKGGAAADIAVKAQAFVDAAEAWAIAADKGDAASMDSLSTALFATCGACHATFRGTR
jgi:hypothetical protein